jgi:malyl-CoA/(S)-citramalyl-CoA lyase
MAKQADILLGNLEDAIPVDKKIPAREGLIEVGKEVDFGETQLWTRVNAGELPGRSTTSPSSSPRSARCSR